MTEDIEHRKCCHDLAYNIIGVSMYVVFIICIALIGYTVYAINNLEIVIK